MLSEVHETAAFVVAPVLSTSSSGDALLAPLALFQLVSGTTPAVPVEAIVVVLLPVKSTLIVAAEAKGRMIEVEQASRVEVRLRLRSRA